MVTTPQAQSIAREYRLRLQQQQEQQAFMTPMTAAGVISEVPYQQHTEDIFSSPMSTFTQGINNPFANPHATQQQQRFGTYPQPQFQINGGSGHRAIPSSPSPKRTNRRGQETNPGLSLSTQFPNQNLAGSRRENSTDNVPNYLAPTRTSKSRDRNRSSSNSPAHVSPIFGQKSQRTQKVPDFTVGHGTAEDKSSPGTKRAMTIDTSVERTNEEVLSSTRRKKKHKGVASPPGVPNYLSPTSISTSRQKPRVERVSPVTQKPSPQQQPRTKTSSRPTYVTPSISHPKRNTPNAASDQLRNVSVFNEHQVEPPIETMDPSVFFPDSKPTTATEFFPTDPVSSDFVPNTTDPNLTPIITSDEQLLKPPRPASTFMKGTVSSVHRIESTSVKIAPKPPASRSRSRPKKVEPVLSPKAAEAVRRAKERTRQRKKAAAAMAAKREEDIAARREEEVAAKQREMDQLRARVSQQRAGRNSSVSRADSVSRRTNSVCSGPSNKERTASRPRRTPSLSSSSRPPVTRPEGPKLRTTAKYGPKEIPSSSPEKMKDHSVADESNMEIELTNGSLSSSARPPSLSVSSRSLRPPVTYPVGPKLSTTAKYGPKHSPSNFKNQAAKQHDPPILMSEKINEFMTKGLRAPSPSGAARSFNNRPRLTQPKPFKFNESKTHSSVNDTKRKRATRTMMETQNDFMRALRISKPMPAKRDMRPTIPIAPNITPVTKKTKPKSTAELEDEMMKNFSRNSFKAREVPSSNNKPNATTRNSSGQSKRKKLTVPQPFRLSTSRPRARETKEENHQEDSQGQPAVAGPVGARKTVPLSPTLNRPASKSRPTRPRLTRPREFNLSASRAGRVPDADMVEMKKKFKARPLPKSMKVRPPVKQRPAPAGRKELDDIPLTISITVPVETENSPGKPVETIATSKVASKINNKMMVEEKEIQPRKQLEAKQEGEMTKPTTYQPVSPAITSPKVVSSQFFSQERREEDQPQLEGHQMLGETEAKIQWEYEHPAMGDHRSSNSPSPRKPPLVPSEQIEPFIQSEETDLRNEYQRHLHEARRQLEEQQRNRLSNIKARPIPKSILEDKRMSPRRPPKPTTPLRFGSNSVLEDFSSRIQRERREMEELHQIQLEEARQKAAGLTLEDRVAESYF